jgi:hypothetical protein
MGKIRDFWARNLPTVTLVSRMPRQPGDWEDLEAPLRAWLDEMRAKAEQLGRIEGPMILYSRDFERDPDLRRGHLAGTKRVELTLIIDNPWYQGIWDSRERLRTDLHRRGEQTLERAASDESDSPHV